LKVVLQSDSKKNVIKFECAPANYYFTFWPSYAMKTLKVEICAAVP